jgi:hypothetical protein
MPLSAVTGAWGSIRLNITKRQVRDSALAGIDHPDALPRQAEKRLRVCDPWWSRATRRVITPGVGWARDHPGSA